MFRDTVVKQIRDLLCDPSMSQRKVAKLLGVSRSTVGRVARNERHSTVLTTDFPQNDTSSPISVAKCPLFLLPHGPYRKCPRCGRRVKMPCLACQLELLREHHAAPKTDSARSLLPEYPALQENS